MIGSAKQIAWAEQIRATWLEHAECQLTTTCRAERADRNQMVARDRAAGVQAVEVAAIVRSSDFWIDYRSTFESRTVRIGVGADLILEQIAREVAS